MYQTNYIGALTQVLKSALIRGVNCGEDYDHHYRRKSRMELTRVSLNPYQVLTQIWAAVIVIKFS